MADERGKSLIEKITDDLERSGFASEIRAFRTFQQRSWSVVAGEVYEDLDENKTREIDLTARMFFGGRAGVFNDAHGTWLRAGERSAIELAAEQVVVHSVIVAEVKRRRSKHWVVLKGGSPTHTDLLDLEPDKLIVLTGQVGGSIGLAAANAALRGSESPDDQLNWLGRTVHESFIEKNEGRAEQGSDLGQPSLWHTAAITVCKAAESCLRLSVPASLSAPQAAINLTHIRPMVILDGQLFTAELGADNSLNIQEVAYAPVRFSFRSKGCAMGRYHLGVVTLGGLDDYLQSHVRWITAVRRTLAYHLLTDHDL